MSSQRFSPEVLDEIRQRVSLRDVISKHVTGLTRKGRDWWACCPFHHEKTPSFHIHESRGYYHCFGCGAHGNAFDFVREMRGGSFVEAVEYLAEMTGVHIERKDVDPRVAKFRDAGFEALTKSAKFYTKCLPGVGYDYFKKRRLSDDIIKEFGLGYAPEDWAELTNFLTQQGVHAKVLEKTGMSLKSSKGDNMYDRFRGRVMFPIQGLDGKVLGFGGRILGDGEPKYLNSPETSFFNKRYTLYNLNRAREHMRKEKRALVVEGYMDVIGLWAHGIHTAVAPLGTAITEDQVRLLWRFIDAPIVCLDGDRAGRGAAVRVARRVLSVLEPGRTLYFAWMPEGEDPDSFVAKNGKDAFDKLLKRTSTIEDVLWSDIVAEKDLAFADGRAAVESEMQLVVDELKNDSLKRHYMRGFKDRLWQITNPNAKKIKEYKERNDKKRAAEGEQARILLSILFRKPQLMELVGEKLSTVSFENQTLDEFAKTLFRFFAGTGVEKDKLDAYLANIGLIDRVKKTLKSDLVDRQEERELEALWLQVYNDLESKDPIKERQQRKQAVEDVFNADDAAQAWERLKQKHGKRVTGTDE